MSSAVSTVAKPVMRGMHVAQIKKILIGATVVSNSQRTLLLLLTILISVLYHYLNTVVLGGQQAQEGGLQELLRYLRRWCWLRKDEGKLGSPQEICSIQ